MKKRIAILQPEVPHYREEFFYILDQSFRSDIYVYSHLDISRKSGIKPSNNPIKYISNKNIKGLLFYSPFPFLSKKYTTIILMLHFAHITTWLLLLTKFLHRKKIILWGQGISVKRYLKEEKHPDWKLKLQIAFADGLWIYMKKEKEMWKKIFPQKKIVALNNTLSGIEEICSHRCVKTKEELKRQYQIKEEIILIYCARFESNYRRVDLLLATIKNLDRNKYGFVIIGAGKNKPDFTNYKNVHDFGAVYVTDIKQDLFSLADIYFQPGWVGLSIVEAMAYGKPIFTFKRTEATKQCVEYDYIKHSYNGMIFDSLDSCIETIKNISNQELIRLGHNARQTATQLTPINMVNNAISILS